MKRAVFLDRDGVINRNLVRNGRPYAPLALDDFEMLPGVSDAVERLRAAGYAIIVVTNQPDVGAGKQSREIVDAMHAKMVKHLAIDDLLVCFHTDEDNCTCRKPKPGMLLQAAERNGINLSESWMVGDRWRDVEAGRACGCRTVFVDYGYENEPRPREPDFVVDSLPAAVPLILQRV